MVNTELQLDCATAHRIKLSLVCTGYGVDQHVWHIRVKVEKQIPCCVPL